MLINYNDKLIAAEQPIIAPVDRVYRYGDGLIESMRMLQGQIPLLQRHVERVSREAQMLQLQLPESFGADFLMQRIEQLVQENGLGENNRINLQLYRAGGGFYVPEQNKAHFIIWVQPYEGDRYTLNRHGLKVAVYPDNHKARAPISNLKSSNSLIYVLAGLYKQQQDLDDCLITNDTGRLVEGYSSNLWLVKGEQVLTPALSEGPVAGAMRAYLLELMQENDIVCTQGIVNLNDMRDADEVFLTNAVGGIRWVGSFNGEYYGNDFSRILIDLLNRKVLGKQMP